MSVDIVTSTGAVSGFTHDHGGHHGYSFNDIFHGSRMADGFRNLTLDVMNSAKSAELATEKTAAATVLAMSLAEGRLALAASDARAAAAECCCEIKEAIRTEACATRELISKIDADNAKVALQNTTAELLAIKYADKK